MIHPCILAIKFKYLHQRTPLKVTANTHTHTLAHTNTSYVSAALLKPITKDKLRKTEFILAHGSKEIRSLIAG